MKFETLELEYQDRVATIWLNRPEVRNAFNETAIAEVTEAFGQVGANERIRVVVLAARGAAFCAGADLNWMRKMATYSHAENLADAGKLAAMLRAVNDCPKPVVARVQGDCYAGGMGLAAACDIVVGADTAGFCLSEVRLGLTPATISPYVIRAIGHSAARRYFLTAERFSAQEALRIGLLHEAVAAEALDDTVARIVAALVANSPHAVGQAKLLVRDVAGRAIDKALVADTVARIATIRASGEGREGVSSFLEKRKPSWLAE